MRVHALQNSPLAEEAKGIDTCVHCGFCLQSCPTYLELEDENDSPRGRIVIMRSLLEGTISDKDPAAHKHISQCLGCRACETACPSGVPYGQMLEATRATLRNSEPLPFIARAILWTFARPWALKASMFFARLLRATPIPTLLSNSFSMAMLASTGENIARNPGGLNLPLTNVPGDPVATLKGCVMEGLFTPTNRATERVLAHNGYQITAAPGQRCCGALHVHAGDLETARKLARHNIQAFEKSGARYIAVNAAGCGAVMKEYGHLLKDDPQYAGRAEALSSKVRDVSELLAAAGPAPGGPLPIRVTYDAPCHLQHAQRIVTPPLAVLSAIPGIELVPLNGSDQCCGSAGIYNLIEPQVSSMVLNTKLKNIRDTEAGYVATGNPGCMMQIGAGLMQAQIPARTVHPVDLLDASYSLL